MKKKILYLLIFTIILTIIPFNVFADKDYDTQLKEVIIKTKKLFNIGSEYDKFSQNVSTHDDKTIFYLDWSDKENKLDNINVSITLDGDIISYGKWKSNYNESRPKLGKVSKEEGLELANDFIKKISPKLANKIKYIDPVQPISLYSEGYNYNFIRIENGLPYYKNNIQVEVDNFTGEIRYYYVNWDMDLIFKDTKDIISLERAQELYKEKIGLKLIYKKTYVDKNPKIFLSYSPLDNNLGINAISGEITSIFDYYNVYTEDSSANFGAVSNLKEQELSPDEEQAIEDISGLISKEEAEKTAREILKLDLEYKLDYTNLYSSWRNEKDYNWEISFTKEEGKEYYYANIRIDARSKELISFFHEVPVDPKKDIQYKEEDCLEIARKYIEKINPDKYNSIELKQNFIRETGDRRAYYYNFIRKIDHAYVEGDSITITVDGVTGKIKNYNLNWSKDKFPSKKNIISINEADNILFEEIGMELKYISTEQYGRESKDKQEAILVYGLKSEKPSIIDANTGSILNYRGDIYIPLEIADYNDIENSYAKDKIKILAKYGISFPGEEFRPKEKINQKDFLYLFAKAYIPYFELEDSPDNLYAQLINRGIIREEEKAPENIVTKEEGVKYLIRALNYDKIADITEIYKDIFKDTSDISQGLKGYISIAYGLKIIEGSNGYLNPKAELSREDSANIIYKYLFNEM